MAQVEMEVDPFLLALTVAADETLSLTDDEKLAHELQLQEVILSSTRSRKQEEMAQVEMEADPFLFALTVADETLSLTDDENLAHELLLQEALVSSTNNTRSRKYAATQSDSIPLCDICEQPIPPADRVEDLPACSHKLCSACLCSYVGQVLQRHKSAVKCPHAGCDALLDPVLYRVFVEPRLFATWFDAHLSHINRGAIVRVSRQDGLQIRTSRSVEKDQVEDPSMDPSFQISTRGDYNGDGLESSGEGSCDPKGKQIVVLPDSMTELGQSSTDAAGDFDCSICMETKKTTESFDVAPCSHSFCRSCIKQYLTTKVEENAATIGCPEPGCKEGVMDPEMCRGILPVAVFDRWGIALCESTLGTAKFYCPYKDCSALLINDDGEEVITDAECPHCRRMLCAQCRVPWHGDINCEGFQKQKDEKGKDRMLVELATESKWQRCPECRMYVEKIDGCMFIKCRCGFGFCYGCGSPMRGDIHFCDKCGR